MIRLFFAIGKKIGTVWYHTTGSKGMVVDDGKIEIDMVRPQEPARRIGSIITSEGSVSFARGVMLQFSCANITI